jgi:hypothetical protein
VAEVVRSGSWNDGSGRVLDSGMAAACSDDFGILDVVHRVAAVTSLVGCEPLYVGALAASMVGVRHDPSRHG